MQRNLKIILVARKKKEDRKDTKYRNKKDSKTNILCIIYIHTHRHTHNTMQKSNCWRKCLSDLNIDDTLKCVSLAISKPLLKWFQYLQQLSNTLIYFSLDCYPTSMGWSNSSTYLTHYQSTHGMGGSEGTKSSVHLNVQDLSNFYWRTEEILVYLMFSCC